MDTKTVEENKMITEEQKDDMLHALGRPTIRKDWKAKTILDKCYRNRYIVDNNNKSWEDLILKGFADKVVQTNSLIPKEDAMYFVTEEGVKYLQENGALGTEKEDGKKNNKI